MSTDPAGFNEPAKPSRVDALDIDGVTMTFYQQGPGHPDLFAVDAGLQAELRRRRPAAVCEAVWPRFVALGEATAGPLVKWMTEAEAQLPVHVPYDAWGRRVDEIRTSPAWECGRELALAISRGVGALIAVGVLAALFVGELERSQASLLSQRQVTADLVALNRDIVRWLSSGLVTVGPDDRVLTINLTGAEILGEVAVGAIGEPLETVLLGVTARLAGLGPTGTVRRAELTLPGAPPRTVGISVSPLFDDRDHVIGRVINFQDLTELRRLETIARRSERLATVGQLAAGIAHEINTPTQYVGDNTRFLKDSFGNLVSVLQAYRELLDGVITCNPSAIRWRAPPTTCANSITCSARG